MGVEVQGYSRAISFIMRLITALIKWSSFQQKRMLDCLIQEENLKRQNNNREDTKLPLREPSIHMHLLHKKTLLKTSCNDV